MAYPESYLNYLVYFHGTRDYFECHEVLEEEWKKDPRGKRKNYWRGLIQVAVTLYHWRRGNFKGALRSVHHALDNLQDEQQALAALALDPILLIEELQQLEQDVINGEKYVSINLPLTDRSLIEQCTKRCEAKGCVMGNPSDLSDDALINKHQQPHRESVISKREATKKGINLS